MSVKWANNRYHHTQARLFLLTSSALARGEPPFPNNVLQHNVLQHNVLQHNVLHQHNVLQHNVLQHNVLQHNVLLITRDPYYT